MAIVLMVITTVRGIAVPVEGFVELKKVCGCWIFEGFGNKYSNRKELLLTNYLQNVIMTYKLYVCDNYDTDCREAL